MNGRTLKDTVKGIRAAPLLMALTAAKRGGNGIVVSWKESGNEVCCVVCLVDVDVLSVGIE